MSAPKAKPITGTKEWSEHSVNCCTGCSHDCRYCYAAAAAARRKQRPRDRWSEMTVRPPAVAKRYGKYDGTVMFPTTHDITPAILGPCMDVLRKLLTAGNRVLIVSKPHVECVDAITGMFPLFRDRILFRFSIGSTDDRVLGFWEPGAPGFAERVGCLGLAMQRGFATSASCEPLLSPETVETLVDTVAPFVSDTIWIGKANQLRARSAGLVAPLHPESLRILAGQTDQRIREIYALLKDNPAIRWKESYKKILGLDLPDRPGLDI